MRPRASTPNPQQWAELKEARRALQKDKHGNVCCGTCWRIEGEQYAFDLHHRHYDNFGNEQIEDLVLLCRSCHEAITSRIRSERYAMGDKSVEMPQPVEEWGNRFRPSISAVETKGDTKPAATGVVRFRPAIQPVLVPN